MTPLANRSIAPDPETQGQLPTGPRLVSSSPNSRASNAARAVLVVANVTPTGYNVGVFMANHARYAKTSDVRRNVQQGEIFTYWPQAKIAAELGCSERQVSRGVRSLREAGALEVRRRVRPCEASYVWIQPVVSGVGSDVRSDGACVGSDVGSGVVSGVGSHTEPRTEPKKNHDRSSSRAREVCKICGNNWPAEYGTTCYRCPQPTAAQLRRQEQRKRDRLSEQDPPAPPDEAPARPDPPPMTPERQAQLETEAIENGYHKRDDGQWTKGPQPPQTAVRESVIRDAEKNAGARGDKRPNSERGDRSVTALIAGSDGLPGPAFTAVTERLPPTEDTEPGPNEQRFKAELAKWTDKRRRRRRRTTA